MGGFCLLEDNDTDTSAEPVPKIYGVCDPTATPSTCSTVLKEDDNRGISTYRISKAQFTDLEGAWESTSPSYEITYSGSPGPDGRVFYKYLDSLGTAEVDESATIEWLDYPNC